MLTIEIQLPSACGETTKRLDVCAELANAELVVIVRLCRWCQHAFIGRKPEHAYCCKEHSDADWNARRRA